MSLIADENLVWQNTEVADDCLAVVRDEQRHVCRFGARVINVREGAMFRDRNHLALPQLTRAQTLAQVGNRVFANVLHHHRRMIARPASFSNANFIASALSLRSADIAWPSIQTR